MKNLSRSQMEQAFHRHPDRSDVYAERVHSRRRFLSQLGGAGLGGLALLGASGAATNAALHGLFGRGLVWAAEEGPAVNLAAERPGMFIHTAHPINGEFPPHLLDDPVTPVARHFVRNNGRVPLRARQRDPQGWQLLVEGEVHTPLRLSLADLKQLPATTLQAVLECGGNGRALFSPTVDGTPWRRGAVGCSEWTGVRLRDVLQKAGLKSSAVYTAHYGEDESLDNAAPFSRGLPIDKAMQEHTLIAYQMNGQDLPALNGYPVRLLVPGWIGSCSQKWLNRIWVRDAVHDSQKMSGYSYRVPAYPIAPGSQPPQADMRIATAWQIKSMITRPEAGQEFAVNRPIQIRGHAWAGEDSVSKVLVSADFGIHWQEAGLDPPANTYAWAHWSTSLTFPRRGYYEIWARAFDDKGNAQPFDQPWNPKGYLGNVIHRLPVQISA